MAWFLLARLLFIAAVGYSAHQLQPLIGGEVVNTLFGLVLGAAVVVFEIRLRDSSVTHMIGARPRTEWLPAEIARDSRGFVLTGADLGDDAGWPLERFQDWLADVLVRLFLD